MQHFGTGGRAQWVFLYTAGQLAHGAQKQKDYREDRAKAWERAQEKVMTEIRSSGIEVTEDVMAQLQISASYSKSGGMRGPTVSINQDLADKFNKCVGKVKEHKDLAEQYEGWIQALQAQPEKELEVTQQDFLYFFMNVKDIPGVVPKTALTPVTARAALDAMPEAKVTSLDPPALTLTGLTPMTAPPLKPKKGEAPMMTVPALGPAASGVFVPPDFGDDCVDGSSALDGFPDD